MKRIQIPNYTIDDLETLLKSKPDYIVGVRLMALIQLKRGMSSWDLEKIYYKSHSRYCIWAKRFNKAGIEGLKNNPRSGRRPCLSDKQLHELKGILLNESPQNFGYNAGTWTGMMLIDFISKKYGVSYKKANIYILLKRKLGLSYQKGRGFYPEADQVLREEFKTEYKKKLMN